MIRIILCGAAGRMGREIINAVENQSDLQITAGIEEGRHPLIGKEINGIPIRADLESEIDRADCVIDYTNHEAAIHHLQILKKRPCPLVIGTTGFTDRENKEIEDAAKVIPVFLSPNMSLGVNHLYQIARETARRLPGFDIEIVETHHRAKKDAPSGTARELARLIKEVRPELKIIYGREGNVGSRPDNILAIHALRGGDIVGEHRICFYGAGEFMELRHYATSRQCFAQGTLTAVRFLVNKPAGLYHMNDVLKLDNH